MPLNLIMEMEVVNDMDLEEDSAARQSFPNIRLRGEAVDSDEDYVQDIVEDVETEADVIKEEDFEEDDNPGMRSVPNVLNCCPLNDSLVSFVIIMRTNEFCPLMLSHYCFITSLLTLHKV